jgi:hypothetical protein
MKLGSNLVEDHPQLSRNKHPVDGALVGVDSIWPKSTNSKPSTPIIMIGQFKTGISNQIIFITFFSTMCTTLLHLL